MKINIVSVTHSICSIGISTLLLTAAGCVLVGSVGIPIGDDDGDEDSAEASDDDSASATGGEVPPDPTATSTSGGSASTTGLTTTSTTGAPPNATATGPVDFPDPLEACGVDVVPPGPDDTYFQEQLTCQEGCTIVVQSIEPINLHEYGTCICAELDCGLAGGDSTTGTFPPQGDDTDTDGASDSANTDGALDPEMCYDFLPGLGDFMCDCEFCEPYEVQDIDFFSVPDLELGEICSCICEATGCGAVEGFGGGGPEPF